MGARGGGDSQAALDAIFAALSDPSRRWIVERLSRGEASVSDLAVPLGISLPAVMKHLRVLEEAGLVACEKTGRVRRCRLVGHPMKAAVDWMVRYRSFWEARLDALHDFLVQNQEPKEDEPT